MVKKVLIWIAAVIFIAGSTTAFAADKGKASPTPNKEAYEHANENARFKRTEDMKNKEAAKAKKEAEKASRAAEKEAKKKQKDAEKETKKMKKGFAK